MSHIICYLFDKPGSAIVEQLDLEHYPSLSSAITDTKPTSVVYETRLKDNSLWFYVVVNGLWCHCGIYAVWRYRSIDTHEHAKAILDWESRVVAALNPAVGYRFTSQLRDEYEWQDVAGTDWLLSRDGVDDFVAFMKSRPHDLWTDIVNSDVILP